MPGNMSDVRLQLFFKSMVGMWEELDVENKMQSIPSVIKQHLIQKQSKSNKE